MRKSPIDRIGLIASLDLYPLKKRDRVETISFAEYQAHAAALIVLIPAVDWADPDVQVREQPENRFDRITFYLKGDIGSHLAIN